VTLADELASIRGRYTAPKCQLAAWAATLDERDREALWAAIHGDRPIREVARVISANGHRLSPATIQNHRAGDCQTCRSQTS
jgi:hypothetical protein